MGDRFDWVSTAWQVLPRSVRVLRSLRPTLHLPDVRALDREFLGRHAVAGLLWDVDGTLMAYHGASVAPELRATLEEIERAGVPQAILSNCDEERFRELGAVVPRLPVLKAYQTPAGQTVLRSAIGGSERWTSRQGGAIPRPEGRLRPHRKPSAELIEVALECLGVRAKDRVFMIGDQYFTDIAGANLAGIKSVKVATFAADSFPRSIRTFQLVERALYRALNSAWV
jgi:predicted HAD superfamily phosphohydrolase YqeG